MEFERLIQQPEAARDERWEAEFLDGILTRKVQMEGDEAKEGPDGWPYFFVRTELDQPDQGEPFVEIVKWLSTRGIGLAVNAHKMLPDYIFPYGMLWNYVETGRFVLPQPPSREGEVVFDENQKVLFGPPSEKYLPLYVRSVLREFLLAQGFTGTKILVATTADYKNVDLVISLDSLGDLPKSQHKTFADMMAWFLPLHYTLMLGPEEGLPKFYDL
jgi:hypothetical protein